MFGNPNSVVSARKEARLASAERLAQFQYITPSSNTAKGAALSFSINDKASNDTIVLFVTESQINAGLAHSTYSNFFTAESLSLSSSLIQASNFTGSAKSTLIIPSNDKRIVLVGLGNVIDGVSTSATNHVTLNTLRNVFHAAIKAVKGIKQDKVSFVIPSFDVSATDNVQTGFGSGIKTKKSESNDIVTKKPHKIASEDQIFDVITRIIVTSNHLFDKYFQTETSKSMSYPIHSVEYVYSNTKVINTVDHSLQVAESIIFARELGNDRSDIVNPQYMEDIAQSLVNANKDVLSIRVLDDAALADNGFNLIRAVGQAATVPPRIIAIEYNGPNPKNSEYVALVGKGITFDTGGLNLKPTGFMEEMHMDMCGSAAVISTMRALALTKPSCKVVGILALAENAIGSKAVKPHAIVESYAGSVMIGNTDAEGRLALADAVSFVQLEYKPSHVIDIATLTGACVVALGEYGAGVFSNDPDLAHSLQSVGAPYNERLWPLPIFPEHQEETNGVDSDIKSTGNSRYGGSSVAAGFLERYIQPDVKWAHVDIAGPANYTSARGYTPKGATGFGVQTLYGFVSSLGK